MLSRFFAAGLSLGLAQALVAALVLFLVFWFARRRQIHLLRDTAIASLRGFIQVIAVGSVLLFVFQSPAWASFFVLLLMVFFAALIAARRAGGVPGAFNVSLAAIGLGAGLIILLMTWLGVIDALPASLIPLGSMLIANAMNANSLALDRFRAEVESHVGQIEAGLALGAQPNAVVVPYVQAAVTASLIPRVDSLRSLGIVWIPGVMTGLILAGSDPLCAAVYQFVVMAMILASSALAAILSTLLIRAHLFSPADQLLLRPQGSG